MLREGISIHGLSKSVLVNKGPFPKDLDGALTNEALLLIIKRAR